MFKEYFIQGSDDGDEGGLDGLEDSDISEIELMSLESGNFSELELLSDSDKENVANPAKKLNILGKQVLASWN